VFYAVPVRPHRANVTLRACLSIDIFPPRRKQRPEPAGDVGPLSDQVMTFPDVRPQVEQHRSSAVDEQLPFAGLAD
jgi:hypothetical protein